MTSIEPIGGYPPDAAAAASRLRRHIQSPRALLGSLSVLAALPLAILTNTMFGGGELIVVHAALGLGMVLLAASVGDFRGPVALRWIGATALLVLGAIFLAQGVAEIVQSPQIFAIVYGDPTIQAMEKLSSYPIILWCLGLVITHSRGKSRILGMLSLAAIALVEIYAFWITSTGGVLDITFRLTYLLAFAWLAVEAVKPRDNRSQP
jgi:hypothetical protein